MFDSREGSGNSTLGRGAKMLAGTNVPDGGEWIDTRTRLSHEEVRMLIVIVTAEVTLGGDLSPSAYKNAGQKSIKGLKTPEAHFKDRKSVV